MKSLIKCFLMLPAIFISNSWSALLFSDDFESGTLSQWQGDERYSGFTYGTAVVDPLDPTNMVLSFWGPQSGGDLLTKNSFASSNLTFTLSFDYLGLTNIANDAGGEIGYTYGLNNNPSDVWLARTRDGVASYMQLIDDSTWHHYDLTFSTPDLTPIYLTLEDYFYSKSGWVFYNSYFDNIMLSEYVPPTPPEEPPVGNPDPVNVPEPSIMSTLLAGLIGLVCFRRKR